MEFNFDSERVSEMVSKAKPKKKATVKSRYVNLDREVILDKSGKRVTNAYVEKILKQDIGVIIGRPSLTGPKIHSPEIKARVPKKLKVALENEAKRRGETSSSIIRAALEKYLKSA